MPRGEPRCEVALGAGSILLCHSLGTFPALWELLRRLRGADPRSEPQTRPCSSLGPSPGGLFPGAVEPGLLWSPEKAEAHPEVGGHGGS